jgi:hypothetical protein
MPLQPFINSLPYAFPKSAFENGLANMPWFELMDELQEIVCAPQWSNAKDIQYLQNDLYHQIGASIVDDEALTKDSKKAKRK